MDDCISRQAAVDALKHNQDVYSHNFHDDPIDKYTTAIIATDIDTLVKLPSAQPEPLTEEEKRLLKKLRSYHSGSYAKILDKLVASAQPEHHVVCGDCVMKNVCRYKTGLGDYGYCSQWKGEEDVPDE